jgi:hypothetical protein
VTFTGALQYDRQFFLILFYLFAGLFVLTLPFLRKLMLGVKFGNTSSQDGVLHCTTERDFCENVFPSLKRRVAVKRLPLFSRSQ